MNTFPAVVTAAGAATRFHPFARAVPKEMLPLGRTPAVEHVIKECLEAGASEVIVVTRPGDDIIPAHVRGLRGGGAPVSCVEEDLAHGYGNGTPLLTLRDRLSACETFAVAFGDDVLLGEPSPGANLAAMHRHISSGIQAVVAAQKIARSLTRSFGIIDTDAESPQRVVSIQQRPEPGTVTEPLAVVSRLMLRPSIMDLLAPTDLAHGEVDLGIATSHLATETPVDVHRIDGRWVTVGDPQRYAEAMNTYHQLHPAGDHHP